MISMLLMCAVVIIAIIYTIKYTIPKYKNSKGSFLKLLLLGGLILIVIYVLFFSFITFSFKYGSISNYFAIKKYKGQGEINVKNYIKSKYKVDPTIKDIDVEYNDCNSTICFGPHEPNGNVEAIITINEKNVYVVINAKKDNIDGYDDYQLKEIKNDLLSYFKNNISSDIYDCDISYCDEEETNCHETINKLYDNNLDEIEQYMKRLKIYSNTDLNFEDEDKIRRLFKDNIDIEIITKKHQ